MMKIVAVDANVLLDYFLKREKRFYQADVLIRQAVDGQLIIFMALPVVLELTWVLKSYYKMPRSDISQYIKSILDIPNCEIMDREFLQKALDVYSKEAGVNFVDCLIVTIYKRVKVDDFITHDLQLMRLYKKLK